MRNAPTHVVGEQTAQEIRWRQAALRAQGVRVAVGTRVIIHRFDQRCRRRAARRARSQRTAETLLRTRRGSGAGGGEVLLDGQSIATLARRTVAQQLGLLLQIYDDAFPLSVPMRC